MVAPGILLVAAVCLFYRLIFKETVYDISQPSETSFWDYSCEFLCFSRATAKD